MFARSEILLRDGTSIRSDAAGDHWRFVLPDAWQKCSSFLHRTLPEPRDVYARRYFNVNTCVDPCGPVHLYLCGLCMYSVLLFVAVDGFSTTLLTGVGSRTRVGASRMLMAMAKNSKAKSNKKAPPSANKGFGACACVFTLKPDTSTLALAPGPPRTKSL